MSEREITIRIAAKNLTATEFAKARADVLGLGNDAAKAKSDGAAMGPAFAVSFSAIAAGAAIAVSGVAALAAGVTALAVHGSDVADVHGQFDVLNRSVGNTSGTLLTTLRGAMRSTVSDFELMKSTNLALSQGLKLNEDQFKLTGQAARVLADRVGGDSKDAYEKLTMAMATGQDKQLKSIGLNIDAEAAVKRHADALGVQVGDLTEAEVITAKRNATLAEMNRILGESGEAGLDFADVVDMGTTVLSNFVDGLSEGIATSPVLTAAIGPIGDAISTAFGGSSAGLIQMIVRLIEDGALAFVSFADSGLAAADSVVKGFAWVESKLAGAAASALELAASLPGATDHMKAQAAAMRQHANDADAAAAGNNAFSAVVGKLREGLAGAQAAMLKAREEQAAASATTADQRAKTDELNAALQRNAAASGAAHQGTTRLTAAQREAAAATKKFTEESAKLGQENFGLQAQYDKGMLGKFVFELKDVTSQESRTIAETAKLNAEAEAWAQTNMAVLAPSILQVGSALDDTGGKGAGFKASLSAAFKDLPGVIQKAFQGGGDVGKSIGGLFGASLFSADSSLTKTISSGLSKVLPAGMSGALSAAIPGIGAAIGPLVGQLGEKLFGKLFKSEGKQVNDLRDAFVSAAGGIGALDAKAHGAGLTLDRLLKAKNVKDFQAAVEELNGAFGKQEADMGLAKQAMEEWGISATEAGQKFAQAEMDTTANDMLAKLRAATAAGVDLNAIVSKGGDDFGKMVHQAIRTGTTISNEFKPVLAAMIENGTLIDENGEKFTDLSQIPFAEDIGSGIKELNLTMRELADFFMTGMKDAFSSAQSAGVGFADRVTNAVARIPREIEIEVNGTYNAPEIEGGNPGYARGTKGVHGSFFVDHGPRRQVDVHGVEAILTPDQAPDFVAAYLRQQGPMAGATQAAPNVYVLVEIDQQGRAKQSPISAREYLRREMQQIFRAGGVQVPASAVGAVA